MCHEQTVTNLEFVLSHWRNSTLACPDLVISKEFERTVINKQCQFDTRPCNALGRPLFVIRILMDPLERFKNGTDQTFPILIRAAYWF
jgi:hypothetical protein